MLETTIHAAATVYATATIHVAATVYATAMRPFDDRASAAELQVETVFRNRNDA
jgi:hypothetical protein